MGARQAVNQECLLRSVTSLFGKRKEENVYQLAKIAESGLKNFAKKADL